MEGILQENSAMREHEQRTGLAITVAVVTYNHGGSIYSCIDSIAAQTYGQMNLVIVDDFSCDFEQKELEAYIHSKYPSVFKSVVVDRFSHHRGAVAAYKRAMELADGEYILFIGGDDRLADQNVIEQAAARLSKHPVDVLQGRAKLMAAEGESILPSEHCLNLLDVGKAFDLFRVTIHEPSAQLLCMQAAFFRTESLRALNAFPDSYQYAVDWPIYTQLLLKQAKFSRTPLIVTQMKGSGAYRTFSVGNVYLRRGYLMEAAKAIREFAISDRLPGIAVEEVLLFESAANAYECLAVKIYDWYYFSLSDKIRWNWEHRDYVRTHRATYPWFGIRRMSLGRRFFTLFAVFLLFAISTLVPPVLLQIPSEIPLILTGVAFAIKLLSIRQKKEQGVVDNYYRTVLSFISLVLVCAIGAKLSDVIQLRSILLLAQLFLLLTWLIDLGVRLCRRLSARRVKQKIVKRRSF